MSKETSNTIVSPLIEGQAYLAAHPDFKLIGRKNELKELSSILMRKNANSVMLTGPGGVGCTALCMGLEAMKADPESPLDIAGKRFFWLDVDRLFSSGDQAQINASFQKMMAKLDRTPESVLVIEDMRGFIDAARNNGCTHFINALILAIHNKKTQVIMESSDDDIDAILKCHSGILETFTLMDVAEPKGETLKEIVTEGAKALEKHHGITISPEAIQAAIEMTNKYRTRDAGLNRAQPERSLTLLDRALTVYRLEAHAQPPQLAAMENRQAALERALKTGQFDADLKGKSREELESMQAALQSDMREAAGRWSAIQAEVTQLHDSLHKAQEEILQLEMEMDEQQQKEQETRESAEAAPLNPEAEAQPRPAPEQAQPKTRRIAAFSAMTSRAGFDSKAVGDMKKTIGDYQAELKKNKARYEQLMAEINEGLLLDRDRVLAEFSRISGISASKLNENEREKLINLDGDLGKRVFGQDDAVTRLSDAVITARMSRESHDDPQASFLFMGPSGVGKTEIAKALSGILLDDDKALTRFDMSEYMEKHAVAKLIGAPPGYEGFEAGGILTNAVRNNPSRILLFDEIEKAHPDVFNLFLQILSDGRLTDNVGRTVSFADCIIIMTTNIGQPFFLDQSLSFEEAKKLANEELNKTYRSEFLNRFSGRENIVCFNRLELDSIKKIVSREIAKLDKAYGDQGLHVEMPQKDIEAFCVDRYDPVTGARGLPGFIKANLKPRIARTLLVTPEAKGVMHVRYNPGTHGFDIDPPVQAAPEQNNEPVHQEARLSAGFNRT